MDLDNGSATEKSWEIELPELNRVVSILRRCNQTLSHSCDEEYLLTEVCQLIVNLAGYLYCWIGFPESNEACGIRVVAYCGAEGKCIEIERSSWGDSGLGATFPARIAIRTNEPVRIQELSVKDSASEEPWRIAAVKHGFQAVLSLPMRTVDELRSSIGALTLYSADPFGFKDEEVALLSDIANDISKGIANLDLRRKQMHMADRFKISESYCVGGKENTETGIVLIDDDENIRFCNAIQFFDD